MAMQQKMEQVWTPEKIEACFQELEEAGLIERKMVNGELRIYVRTPEEAKMMGKKK